MNRVNLTAMPDEEWARRLAESFERAAETADPFTAKWYRREAAEMVDCWICGGDSTRICNCHGGPPDEKAAACNMVCNDPRAA